MDIKQNECICWWYGICFYPALINLSLKLPVWKWGPAPEDCWSCLWDKKPVKRKKNTRSRIKQRCFDSGSYFCVCVCVCVCTHLLPEVQSPGNIGVGVVLFIGALMELRLDGLRLYRKLSRNYTKQETLHFSFYCMKWACYWSVAVLLTKHPNIVVILFTGMLYSQVPTRQQRTDVFSQSVYQ